MQIYMLTLEIVDAYDAQLAGAVVIAETATQARELTIERLDEDWEAASIERIGVAVPGLESEVIAVDMS